MLMGTQLTTSPKALAQNSSASKSPGRSELRPEVPCVQSLTRGFMYVQPMMPPRPPLNIIKLSDNFGQYVVTLKCTYGHAKPRTLAAIAGWEAKLQDVITRLRCSRCGNANYTSSVRHETKRDG